MLANTKGHILQSVGVLRQVCLLEVRGRGSNRRNRGCVPLPLQVAVDGSLRDLLEGHTTGTIVLSNPIGLRHGYSHL